MLREKGGNGLGKLLRHRTGRGGNLLGLQGECWVGGGVGVTQEAALWDEVQDQTLVAEG